MSENNSAITKHWNEVLRLNQDEVRLKVKYPDIGKPYYLTYTSINAPAITEPLPNRKITDNGSSSFQWWARKERIRTSNEFPIQIDFHQLESALLNG